VDEVIKLDVVFPLRIIEYPAPDLPATWIAHALDLDIVAQGSTPAEAERSLRGALMEMIAYRLSEGMAPVEWSPASEELWAAAEITAGERLDREPPELRFQVDVPGEPTDAPEPRVFVTDRAPVLAAHAG
jgi:hypothetical protein